MSKHTEGKWSVDRRASCRVVDSNGQTVASTGGGGSIEPEHQANAKLIRAVPEMLEMLKCIARIYSESAKDFDEQDRDMAVWAVVESKINPLITEIESE
jgi:hypothetical protein